MSSFLLFILFIEIVCVFFGLTTYVLDGKFRWANRANTQFSFAFATLLAGAIAFAYGVSTHTTNSTLVGVSLLAMLAFSIWMKLYQPNLLK